MPEEFVYVASCCLRTHAGDFAGWGIYGGDNSQLNDYGTPFEQTSMHAELSAIMYAVKKVCSMGGGYKWTIMTGSYEAYWAIEGLKDINGPEFMSNDQSQTLNAIRTLLSLAHKQYIVIEVRLCSSRAHEFHKALSFAKCGAQRDLMAPAEPSYLESLQQRLQ